MNLIYLLSHPVITLKRSYYYLFGITIGQLFYSKRIFKSKYFTRPGSEGWTWLCHDFFYQHIIGTNKHIPWPCAPGIRIVNPSNINFHVDDLNNFQTDGVYYQAIGRITIGEGSYIAPNVGLITENHDIYDPDKRGGQKDIVIGKKCWIGMNSVILPGVQLGDHTVVGAGSVVTKSFSEGYVVLVGNPAHVLKEIK